MPIYCWDNPGWYDGAIDPPNNAYGSKLIDANGKEIIGWINYVDTEAGVTIELIKDDAGDYIEATDRQGNFIGMMKRRIRAHPAPITIVPPSTTLPDSFCSTPDCVEPIILDKV